VAGVVAEVVHLLQGGGGRRGRERHSRRQEQQSAEDCREYGFRSSHDARVPFTPRRATEPMAPFGMFVTVVANVKGRCRGSSEANRRPGLASRVRGPAAHPVRPEFNLFKYMTIVKNLNTMISW